MDCNQALPQLQSRLDEALAAEPAAALDGHLAHCPPCRRAFHTLKTAQGAIREHADCFRAPGALRSRILAELAAVAAAPPVSGRGRARRSGHPGRLGRWGWFGSGAALAASLTLVITLTLAPVPGAPLEDQVVSAHIRSLMENHLMDIASSDRHTVKPWFNGRLDLAPPVRDFEAVGFPLAGGRLDVLDQRPVAALVYRRRQHVINLFIAPADGAAAGLHEASPTRGYTVLHWSDGGLADWLVSDLERTELLEFARLLRSPPPVQ